MTDFDKLGIQVLFVCMTSKQRGPNVGCYLAFMTGGCQFGFVSAVMGCIASPWSRSKVAWREARLTNQIS